ncbi:ribosome hibernation factor-recruiting GTPase MRF [Saccharothrix longispora]|uniref:ribosome hibernation factor-recruiting GTPase MRF n=1 Tax=Saccharothrix longispora TaxID=33920 RepID=UPI0028FDB251|nr:GTP-binding protein [Saccharothrix longispora]MBY8851370.1 GTP-binding protein [Saccharothrix sp. MB29]MDU0287580.1 GTP-binding protein [Saccharothrix longispora]
MRTEVVLVAGLADHDVAEELWRACPGSVLVRHDLRDLAGGVVRRWVDGELTVLELAHGCVSCTLRLDLLPLLERLGGRVVVHLDPALEPEAVCFALREVDVRVEAVVTVVDRAAWLADATGEDALADRGLAAAEADDRTVAQVVVGQAEFADALVLTGVGTDPVLDAVLDRLNPRAPRRDRHALDAAELLAAVPDDARRGRFDDGFGTLLHGQPPLEPAHGVAVVHFVERRPFHPMRLHEALDVLFDGVVRTRGRVWVASQPDTALWLESAGGGLNVGNLGPWLAAVDDWSGFPVERRAAASATWDPVHGDRSQELVVITASASPEEITAALREALVTDEELALADELEFADPFAEWHDEMEEA